MKKIKFSFIAIIAIVLALSTSAFTSVKHQTNLEDDVYAFDNSGNLIGQGTVGQLESGLCDGSGQFCAHIWTDVTEDEEPAGEPLADMYKRIN